MAGRLRRERSAERFEGLSEIAWKLFEDLMPQSPEKKGRGMPYVAFRSVLNTQLYVLITVDGATYHEANNGHQKVLLIGG